MQQPNSNKMNLIAPSHPSAEPDEFTPEKLRAWLSSLAAADAIGSARASIERLVALNRARLQSRTRLRLLDMFRDHIEWLLPQLEGRVARAQPPLAGTLRQAAYCIEKLLKELAAGYSHLVLRVPRTWLSGGSKSQLHVPLARALDFHARRLALSQRMYTRSPAAVWAEMHQLFQLARDAGLADRETDSPHTSPLRVYREALLLAFAEPTKLMHGDFARVQNYLAANGDLAEIVPKAKVELAQCVFAIDPRRDRPGVAYSKRADAGYQNGDLMLVTHKLVERLEIQLRKLADGVAPASLGLPHEAAQSHYQELLQRLLVQWRGERKNRSARMRFHPRVDLWVGLREIWRQLRSDLPKDEQADITQREGPPRATEWIIVNESGRGFALSYMSGILPPINVGEIVALKTRERNAIYVCLVRWILSNNPEHYELGLQQLGPIVVPAVYKPSEADRSAPEPILFFPEMPAQRRAPVVAAPPNRVRVNGAFSLRHRLGRLSLCAARVVETTPSIELVEVVAPSP